LPAGRASFQLARYMYLADWKGNPPVNKVRKPFQLARYMYLAHWKGNPPVDEVHALPAGRKPFQPEIGFGYPLGYPDICQVWGAKRPSGAESTPPGGYPPADNGLSATSSNDAIMDQIKLLVKWEVVQM
jgi:hypothetical protein